MLKGFMQFILRGNVVDLAIAVMVGAAFNSVVTALVKDVLTPFITAIIGKPDFSELQFAINKSVFHYGDFLNSVISFVLVASTIYFCIVAPMNAILERLTPRFTDTTPTVRVCPECLSEIPAAATRCKFCAAASAPIV